MASSSPEQYQGTGSHTDKGVPLIIGLVLAVILLMAIVTQGHNTVTEGTNPPPGAYSSAAVNEDTGS